MNLLIALLPALLWGVLPLAISKVGGRPIHQIIGTTTGTLLVAIVVYLIVQPSPRPTSGGAFFPVPCGPVRKCCSIVLSNFRRLHRHLDH